MNKKQNFRLPPSLKKTGHHYCPGCGHGIAHRLLAESLDEMNLTDKAVAIAPVGCAVFGYYYWNFDTAEAAHGRPPAVATAIKRMLPDRVVITYQGDGDLAAIGGNEILHAAGRGENISVFFVNNSCYGMTGGQMAPTTLMGQKTTTTPSGRSNEAGYPIKMCELLSGFEGVSYSERVSLRNPASIMKAKRAVRKALRYQMEGKGLTLVEFLSPCPTGWKVSPEQSLELIKNEMEKTFPPGVYKDSGEKQQ